MIIEHVRLFVRIAQTHNISLAGQELGLSPAVASSYLNKLESSLSVRLLHRTTRKVSLTEDGQTFLPFAEDVLASVDAAQASLGQGESTPSGTLRVSAPASFGRIHLMPEMKGFMQAYPQLKVDLRFSDSIVDLVEGGFDIAIRNAELKNSSLVARKLADDHRILCASPDYLEQFGHPQTPEDLSQHECLVLAGLDHWQLKGPNGITTIKARGRFRADNGETVRDACVQGLGITICSKWIAYKYLQRKELVEVMGDYKLVDNSAIWAVYPSSRQLAPKVRAFIDYFVAAFNSQSDW
ncbi:LysR family transcriptional regulator [Marinibactrum halimedae]|uniref:LysR family transcriptional regulator n=1 Tax=Marinibactrum halimedae TaxID=1444977 RepID=A0AA37T4Q8_9GAMM|nr:LysR family transcriptional regulator [Marinibactrum halimedae]MCD9461062.1 LysR family transcriptional regulator [Marinibactrum halimedae]GLS26729.1 LysR family transcriptional regulator [Marinibactrum halimedae]